MYLTLVLGIIVIPLAVWRLSNMVADTDQGGPFGLLDWLRAKAGVYYDEQSMPHGKKGRISEMLLCVYCNSIWIGILFTIALLLFQIVTIIVSMPLALSAVAILLEEWRTKK